MHQSSFDRMKKFKEKYLDTRKTLRILDLGSFDVNGSYADLFKEELWQYFGADVAKGKNVNILLDDPYHWYNVQSNFYDIVISGQTYEHIEYFWITMLQISRVLKEDGIACIIAPAGGYEHRYPVDCWRFYPDGMIALAKWAKLNILEANTHWQSSNYTDDSDLWMDSVLVCKKNKHRKEIEHLLTEINSWMSMGGSQEFKRDDDASSYEEQIISKQRESQNWKTLTASNEKRDWYDAISSLLSVYFERRDLQEAFPTVKKGGTLLDLLRWARDFGVKEDVRLVPHYDFYNRFSADENIQ